MKTYHDGFKGVLEETMLFDIENDPHETIGLADDRPDVVTEGKAKLQRWHDERVQEATSGTNGALRTPHEA